MICKWKEGVGGREEKWELASCVAVGDLYTISELCASWQAVYLSDRVRHLALYNTRCTLPVVRSRVVTRW